MLENEGVRIAMRQNSRTIHFTRQNYGTNVTHNLLGSCFLVGAGPWLFGVALQRQQIRFQTMNGLLANQRFVCTPSSIRGQIAYHSIEMDKQVTPDVEHPSY